MPSSQQSAGHLGGAEDVAVLELVLHDAGGGDCFGHDRVELFLDFLGAGVAEDAVPELRDDERLVGDFFHVVGVDDALEENVAADEPEVLPFDPVAAEVVGLERPEVVECFWG